MNLWPPALPLPIQHRHHRDTIHAHPIQSVLQGGPKIVAFQDFAIRFGTKQPEGYPIRVSAGAASGDGFFRIPFSSGELETILAELGGVIRRSAATAGVRAPRRHLVPVADEAAPAQQLRTFGAKLFRALFSGQVGNLYHFCRGGVERTPDRGLRIMLRFDSKHPDLPRLSNLPWELLYDEDRRAFLVLSRFTPIIRCLEVPHPGAPLIFQPPLRILVVISRLVSHGALNLAEERRLIEGAWEKHRAVEVTFLEPATVTALREAVLQQPYQVVHFMGHGAFGGHLGEGTLLFEQSDGTTHAVSGSSLASLLGDARSLRLIVLNACDTARVSNQQGFDPLTGVATALIAGGLFAVVAMQFPISDQAAIAFTRSFYPRLAAGDPVDAATAEGRLAIRTENQYSLEWSTPVLFMRSPEGIPFEDLVPKLVKAEPGASPTGRDDFETDLRAASKPSFFGLLAQLFMRRETKPRRPQRPQRPLRAFLCYASEDQRTVRRLCEKLRKKNISVWLDREDLLPGQNWKFEINEALRTSDVVIVCLSDTSLTKEGYIQKEIRDALDIAEEKPKETIFIIPLRLEKCTIPRRLSRWQYVDLFQARGLARLMNALRRRAEELDLAHGAKWASRAPEHSRTPW